MHRKTLPRVRSDAYWSHDIQSQIARKWLKYKALHELSINIEEFRFAEHVDGIIL